MSHLGQLNQALMTVIIRYAEASSHSADSSDKPMAAAASSAISLDDLTSDHIQLYIQLMDIIEQSTKVDSAESTYLRELLNQIVALAVFLKPAKPQASAAQEDLPCPFHEQLIRGQKIPTREELEQQLIDLAHNAQQISESEEEYFLVQEVKQDSLLTTEKPRPEKILHEEMFLALQLKPNVDKDTIKKKIKAIFEEHQTIRHLIEENKRLAQANKRLTQAAEPQQTRGPSSPHFKFASLAQVVVDGLADIFFDNPSAPHDVHRKPPTM